MPEIFKQGLFFGSDIVFTYGPLGFLSGNVVPTPWIPFILLFRFVLLIIFCELSLDLLKERGFGFKLGYFVLFGLLSVLGWNQFLWSSVPLLAIFRSFAVPNRACMTWHTLGAVYAAMMAFIKFNFFITSCACYLLILLYCFKNEQKRFALVPFVFFISLFAIWTILGQPVSNLFIWISLSLNLASGYSEAMCKGFSIPYNKLDVLILYSSLLVIVLGSLLNFATKKIKLVLFCLCTFLSIIAVQHSIGGNQIQQAMSVVILLSVLLFCFGQGSKIKFGLGRSLFALGLAGAVSLQALNNGFRIEPPYGIVSLLKESVTQAYLVVTRQENKLEGFYENSLLTMRSLIPELENLTGTADSFPENSAMLIAFPNIQFHPRPAYLSLNAHTEKLVRYNGDFYRSAKRPKNVLIEIVPFGESVNTRLPMMADKDAVLEVLYNYDFRSKMGPFLWFEDLQKSVTYPQLVQTHELILPFDVALDIKTNSPIWIDIDFKKTFLGSIVSAIYKSSHIEICYTIVNETVDKCFQILPGTARSGFILNPLIQSTEDLQSFVKQRKATWYRNLESSTVTNRFYFKTESTFVRIWQRNFKIRFYKIEPIIRG